MGSGCISDLLEEGSLEFEFLPSYLAELKPFRTKGSLPGLFRPTACLFLLLTLFAGFAPALYGARTAATPPTLESPAPGGTLPGSTVTFAWTAGTDVGEYVLHVNTAPGNPVDPSSTRLFNSGTITSTSLTVNNLPTSGAPIYVILGARYSDTWHYVTYAYVEASTTPILSGLTCTSGSMTGAGTDSCTVTLSAAASTGGVAVSLTSNSSAVTVSASVTVASGATRASFTATVTAVSSAQTATVTASASGSSKTFSLSLGACVPTLSVSTASLSFGNDAVNSAITQTLTLSSTGTAAVSVSAAAISGSGHPCPRQRFSKSAQLIS
jgi:hypothetical protein